MTSPARLQTRDLGAQLHDNLRRHLACTELLLTTLEQEREALLANDVGALERVSDTKSSAAQALRDLGEALGALRSAAGVATMKDFIGRFPELPGLTGQWQDLLQLAAECQRSNRENAALLDARQAQVRSAIRTIQGNAAPSTYGRAGQSASGFAPRSLGSA